MSLIDYCQQKDHQALEDFLGVSGISNSFRSSLVHRPVDEATPSRTVCMNFVQAKFSNTTSVGKNMNFNQVRGRITFLPSLVLSHYALL